LPAFGNKIGSRLHSLRHKIGKGRQNGFHGYTIGERAVGLRIRMV
jgi:hypothetical protein